MQLAPNDILTVTRLVADVDNHSQYTSTVYSGLSCYSEPIRDELALGAFDTNAGYPKKAYDFGGVFDVRIGDKVVDSHGVTYLVKGVRIFEDNLDIDNDMEILMIRES